jgi:hypothetical protein
MNMKASRLFPIFALAFGIFATYEIRAEPEAGKEIAERVVVGGEVVNGGKPQLIRLTKGMTLSMAINRAGGYSEYRHLKIFLIRAGKQTAFTSRDLDKKSTTLEPWDVVWFGDPE